MQVHYLAGLQRVGCVVKSVLGDGNCLFRSFSHQVYGSEDHHAIMRRVACDYMVRSAPCGCLRLRTRCLVHLR